MTKKIVCIMCFFMMLSILPMQAMQSLNIERKDETQHSLLNQEAPLTLSEHIHGGLAITVGFCKLAKVGYISFALNEEINTIDKSTQGEIVIVTETTMAVWLITYGVCILKKWIIG